MTLSVDFQNRAVYAAAPSTTSRKESVPAGDTGVTGRTANADKVTISDAARNKLANADDNWKEKLIANAKANPQEADRYLDASTSVTIDGPLVDLSDPPKIKLSSTGEIWTPEKQKAYESVSKGVMQNRRDLYLSERAKGTAPADILTKIFSYNDSLPQWYQDGMNWTSSSRVNPAAASATAA